MHGLIIPLYYYMHELIIPLDLCARLCFNYTVTVVLKVAVSNPTLTAT